MQIEKEGKHLPRGWKTGDAEPARGFKASWWCDMRRLSGFSPLHILTNRQQKSWFVGFFPHCRPWYICLLSGISQLPCPRAICRYDRLAFYLLVSFWMALKPGWLYFPEKTRHTPIPPLRNQCISKDFMSFFGGGGAWNKDHFLKSLLNLWHLASVSYFLAF